MIPKSNLPHFFYDADVEKSHESEELIDFFISWTLRCAIDDEKIPQKVNEYSRKVLFKLLEEQLKYVTHDAIEVKSVEMWKQWAQIDLLAEVIIEIDNKQSKFVIVIEDKLYTHIHSNQLAKYQKTIEYFYANPINGKQDYIRVYVFLTCYDEVPEADRIECKKTKIRYNAYAIQDLRDTFGKEETGNYLFDEFWFRYFFHSDEVI